PVVSCPASEGSPAVKEQVEDGEWKIDEGKPIIGALPPVTAPRSAIVLSPSPSEMAQEAVSPEGHRRAPASEPETRCDARAAGDTVESPPQQQPTLSPRQMERLRQKRFWFLMNAIGGGTLAVILIVAACLLMIWYWPEGDAGRSSSSGQGESAES